MAELDVEFPPPAEPAKRYRDIADVVLDRARLPGTPIRISSPAAIPFIIDGGYEQRVSAAAELRFTPMSEVDLDFLLAGRMDGPG